MQDMIVLITGRRVFMLHGDGSGGGGVNGGGVYSANSSASGRHIYGVVEWEVDFGLVVWLEIDDGDGEKLPPTASSGERLTKRGTGGGGGDGGGSGTSLSLYHFPDLSVERGGAGKCCCVVRSGLRLGVCVVVCKHFFCAASIKSPPRDTL